MGNTLDQTTSLLAAVIRMYGKDDELPISREAFESLDAPLRVEVRAMDGTKDYLMLCVASVQAAVVKPRHLTLVK